MQIREGQRREKTVLIARRLKKREQKKEEEKKIEDNGNTFTVNRKSKGADSGCIYVTSSLRFYERIIIRNTGHETIK